jgi:hypothetical protein
MLVMWFERDDDCSLCISVAVLEIVACYVFGSKSLYVFPGTVKAEACKTFPEQAPNTTDIDLSLKQLKSNDPGLVELNLNNIKVGWSHSASIGMK